MSGAPEILQAAAERVARGWCRFSFARDKDGRWVDVHDPRAACFCAYGAILASGGDHDLAATVAGLLPPGPGRGLGLWNDHPDRTQAEVVALLQKAARAMAR